MKRIADIEAEFDCVVRKAGGVPVRELLGTKSPHFENADYYFDREGVVAELKILEKDPTEGAELERKVQAKFQKWSDEGKLITYGALRIESSQLPQEMQWELARIYSAPVKKVIKTRSSSGNQAHWGWRSSSTKPIASCSQNT